MGYSAPVIGQVLARIYLRYNSLKLLVGLTTCCSTTSLARRLELPEGK